MAVKNFLLCSSCKIETQQIQLRWFRSGPVFYWTLLDSRDKGSRSILLIDATYSKNSFCNWGVFFLIVCTLEADLLRGISAELTHAQLQNLESPGKIPVGSILIKNQLEFLIHENQECSQFEI